MVLGWPERLLARAWCRAAAGRWSRAVQSRSPSCGDQRQQVDPRREPVLGAEPGVATGPAGRRTRRAPCRSAAAAAQVDVDVVGRRVGSAVGCAAVVASSARLIADLVDHPPARAGRAAASPRRHSACSASSGVDAAPACRASIRSPTAHCSSVSMLDRHARPGRRRRPRQRRRRALRKKPFTGSLKKRDQVGEGDVVAGRGGSGPSRNPAARSRSPAAAARPPAARSGRSVNGRRAPARRAVTLRASNGCKRMLDDDAGRGPSRCVGGVERVEQLAQRDRGRSR